MSALPPPATDAGGDLRQILTQLNQAAYRLAQHAAQLAPVPPHLVAQADDLDVRLAAVSPRIDTASPAEQPELAELWTDARLDLDYILSSGSQPTSIRLHHFLAGRERQPAAPPPPQVVGRNHWVARDEPPFAAWTATLPAPIGPAARARVLQVVGEILAAGAAAGVYEVRATSTPPSFQIAQHGSYAQFLAQQEASGARVTLFDLGSGVAPTASGQLVTPARLSYFDAAGALTEAEVANLGALLHTLRPADRDWGSSYMAQVAPVTITSPALAPPGTSARLPLPFTLTIALFTDIWFPQVLALLDGDQPPASQPRRWTDNRVLAGAHTPRLNRFLAAAQQAVLAAGGTWEIDEPEGTAVHFAPQVTLTGIRLDP